MSVVAQTKNSKAVLLLEHEATPKGLNSCQCNRLGGSARQPDVVVGENVSSTAHHLGPTITTEMVESTGMWWTKGFQSCTPAFFSTS